MRLIRVLATIWLLVCSPALADARYDGYIRLAGDASGDGSCEISDPGPGGFVKVYVVVKGSPGIAAVSFSAPIPASSGLQYVVENVNPAFVAVGNSQTHIDIALGTCVTGTVSLMEMTFFRAAAGDACTPYQIQPGSTQQDCAFDEWPLWAADGVALNSNGSCNPVPIRSPSPADGAVDVPLTTNLDWEDAYYLCNAPLAASGTGLVHFGTTPDPPFDESATTTHRVGPLNPATKYYWKVYNDYPSAFSPVWSFTTTNTTAATPSTWGSIKALYR